MFAVLKQKHDNRWTVSCSVYNVYMVQMFNGSIVQSLENWLKYWAAHARVPMRYKIFNLHLSLEYYFQLMSSR